MTATLAVTFLDTGHNTLYPLFNGLGPMRLTLVRFYSDSSVTLGSLIGPSGVICFTLELPWRFNSVSVSCIPVGLYTCSSVVSPRFGSTFSVSVPRRSGILFHPGNSPLDTQGCILPVSFFSGLKGLRSKQAMDTLRQALTGVDTFDLLVK